MIFHSDETDIHLSGGINMPRPIHNTERLSIYLSPETMDGLRINSTKESRSMSEHVRHLIESDIKFNQLTARSK